MTALAASFEMKEKEGFVIAIPMAVDVIYKGSLCKINAAGYLEPCASEAGSAFAGVAIETIDNSAGSAGDKVCRVQTEGIFKMVAAGLTQADVGSLVYATDDNLVTVTAAASKQIVGRIMNIDSATEPWVRLGDKTLVPVGV